MMILAGLPFISCSKGLFIRADGISFLHHSLPLFFGQETSGQTITDAFAVTGFSVNGDARIEELSFNAF